MGDRTSKLWTIGQLIGKKIDTTEDVREHLAYLPYSLIFGDLRNLDRLDAIIDYLKANPSPPQQHYNQGRQLGRIEMLQQMGLWVIVERCARYHASTDAIIGYESYLVEAHTEETTAVERLTCYRVDDNSDRETVLLEPYWNVWTQLHEFAPVEKRATLSSKSLAEGYAHAWATNYFAIWICTADKEVCDMANPFYIKVAPNPTPNPHLNDPDDTPF